MNRRRLLGMLGAGSWLAITATGRALSAAKGTGPRWKTAIGLNGFMSASRKYHKVFPIWEVLDFASQNGFDGVELVEGWPTPGGYPHPREKRRIGALRRMYDGFGLQIFSIQTGAGRAFHPELAVRKQWLKHWEQQARFAKAVGAECIGLWPGGPLGNQTLQSAIDHFANSLHEVCEIAERLGLVVSFEIEPPFVFHTEEHLRAILRKANHPLAKTMFDPSHFDLMSGSTGKVSQMLRRIGVENIGYVHLTDCDGTLRDGGTSKHLPCGEGHVDIDASLALLREGGYQGWIMIDAWEVPDPYEACIKGKQAIDRAMAG